MKLISIQSVSFFLFLIRIYSWCPGGTPAHCQWNANKKKGRKMGSTLKLDSLCIAKDSRAACGAASQFWNMCPRYCLEIADCQRIELQRSTMDEVGGNRFCKRYHAHPGLAANSADQSFSFSFVTRPTYTRPTSLIDFFIILLCDKTPFNWLIFRLNTSIIRDVRKITNIFSMLS